MAKLLYSFLLLLLLTGLSISEEQQKLTISVKDIKPKPNDYYCTSLGIPADEQYAVGFEPEVDATKVHHLLLFGCKEPYSVGQWDCKTMGGTCKGEDTILFAWGKNASGLELPEGVGFKLGSEAGIRSIVLQLHYGDMSISSGQKGTDSSGISLSITKTKPPNVAGVFLIIGSGTIPSGHEDFSVEGGCNYSDKKTITPFAYRVHAHTHSTVITGYYKKSGSSEWVLIGSKSPQDPQAFYPILNSVNVSSGDILAARCLYNTKGDTHDVHIGPDTMNEMCNLYIMYYMANDNQDLDVDMCGIGTWDTPIHPPPLDTVTTQSPTTPTTTPPTTPPRNEVDHGGDTVPMLQMSADWMLSGLEGEETSPILSVGLGQVSAVEVDHNGNVLILHRGSRGWDYSSFGVDNVFKQKDEGPISEPVVLHLSSNGQILHKWGENMFYMPHGLTIDPSGNIWITDVAMHQIFKFSPDNREKPVLTLGTAFEPGSDSVHFCKPAAIAVDQDGYFYVADGYCNHRIIKYSPTGGILQVMDKPVDGKSFFIPHSLALLNEDTQLMLADRENSRLVIVETSNISKIVSVIKNDAFGDALYAVTAPQMFNPVTYVYVVNYIDVKEGAISHGLTVMLKGGEIHQTWNPTNNGKEMSFGIAHDIATSADGQTVYVAEVQPNRIWKFVHETKNKFDETPKNRSIGLKDPSADGNDTTHADGDISIHADGNNTVRVQDETNMPSDNYGEGLSDDKNVTHLNLGEDEEDEEDALLVSLAAHEIQATVQPSLTASDRTTILQETPPPSTKPPPPSTKAPPPEPTKANLESSTEPILPLEDNSTDYECPKSVPPENCVTSGPIQPVLCSSGTECIAQFVNNNLNIVIVTIVFFVLGIIAVFAVLLVLCRKRVRCRGAVRGGLSEKAKQAKQNIHSLIGPNHKGFMKVRTFDSDSEAEDVVFQRL